MQKRLLQRIRRLFLIPVSDDNSNGKKSQQVSVVSHLENFLKAGMLKHCVTEGAMAIPSSEVWL